jgi:hypothetical protein
MFYCDIIHEFSEMRACVCIFIKKKGAFQFIGIELALFFDFLEHIDYKWLSSFNKAECITSVALQNVFATLDQGLEYVQTM